MCLQHQVAHLLNKHLLSAYCIREMVLGPGRAQKEKKIPDLRGLHICFQESRILTHFKYSKITLIADFF